MKKYVTINNEKITEGDRYNIYFTTYHGKHRHDCIYVVHIGVLGDLQFRFVELMWENFGHNQYPIQTTLRIDYNTLGYKVCGPGCYKLLVRNSLNNDRLDESDYFKKLEANKWKQ